MSITAIGSGSDAFGSGGAVFGVSDTYPAYTPGTSIDYAGPYLAAAGITDPTQQAAVYQLETRLKAAGVLSDVSRAQCLDVAVYPIIGGTSLTHRVNFIDPTTYPLTFYGSPLHSGTGIAWTGAQHADTGLVANSLDPFNVRLSVYTRAQGSATGADMGTSAGGGADLYLSTYSADGARPYCSVGGLDVTPTTIVPAGYFALSAIADPDHAGQVMAYAYRNAAPLIGVVSGTPAPLAPTTIFLGALNVNGSRGAAVNREACYYSIGRAYTSAQETAVAAAVQELQTTLTRAV